MKLRPLRLLVVLGLVAACSGKTSQDGESSTSEAEGTSNRGGAAASDRSATASGGASVGGSAGESSSSESGGTSNTGGDSTGGSSSGGTSNTGGSPNLEPGMCIDAAEEWQACNDCSVCSERVASNYRLYFHNNPQCEASDDCEEEYFSCNSNCPKPTSEDVCAGSEGEWKGCRGDGCSVCSDLVSAYKLYYINHPLCVKNDACEGQSYTCNQNCPEPTGADVCRGSDGGWEGCRGDGCSVCSELLTDYPNYFKNHPHCVKNDTCDGLTYDCNENCPEPSEADR